MTSRRSQGPPSEPMALFEIVHTARLVERAHARAVADAGLSPGQFGILAAINDEPGVTQAGVARILSARPQSIARTIAQLITEGLIAQDRPSRRGSATALRITDLGREALDRAWPTVLALGEGDRLGLTEDQVTEMVRALRAVREHLGER